MTRSTSRLLTHRSAIYSLLSSAFALIATIRHAHATTTIISPGPTTIHTAVAAAAIGDTIVLAPGRYALDYGVNIDKPMTIMSQLGPDNTIVDLQNNFGSVFFVRPMSGGPTIQGLTIMRGLQAATAAGGGVYANQANITLLNNLVIGNTASDFDGAGGLGAGICAMNGDVVIRNNTIAGNAAGGGALFLYVCTGSIDHNVIAYNGKSVSSSDGYGLSCVSTSAAIRDNIFWANRPDQIDPICDSALPQNNNITLDPKFCNPQYRSRITLSDWHPATNSPLAPGNDYYGWGAPLAPCGVTSATPTSWGRLKSHYRI